jgi:hypothetical protein
MHPPISAERWSAARALCEGKAPTYARIAQAMGCHPTTLKKRAGLEGWKKKNFESLRLRKAWPYGGGPGGFDLAGLAALAAGGPTSRGSDGEPGSGAGRDEGDDADAAAPNGMDRSPDLDALDKLRVLIGRGANNVVANAEANGGRIDTGALDTLAEATKVFERAEKLAFPMRLQQQKRSDDELATTLRSIDDRIIELAEAHARWLVAERDRGRQG